MTVTAQVLQRAISQKTKPKYLTSAKAAVRPPKATAASQRPRTEQDTDTTHKPCKLLIVAMKNDDILVRHVAEDSTSQPRLDEKITRTVALLNADDKPQRGLDRSQERRVDHRGAIPPHIADVPEPTTCVEVDLKRNPADQRPKAGQKIEEHKMQPRRV